MPKQIKNLKKTAKRIKKATENGEKIIIYGDADLDGISSIVILKEAINNLNGKNISFYIPDRENEGYGINKKALNYLKNEAPALLIGLDLGISNFKEIKKANKLGFEVIIIDHHETLDKLPEASIIVDPRQKGDEYPLKELATCGIVFWLSKKLLGDNLSESLEKSFLELVALGTLADMMPEKEDNKEFIKKGLISLENTLRPGLKVFFDTYLKKTYQQRGIRDMAWGIISALNAGKNQDHLHETFFLLTSSSFEESEEIAENLLERKKQRRMSINEVIEEVKKRIANKIDKPIIFEGDPSWELNWAGAAASELCNNYKKPVFIYKKGKEKSRGGVRVPKGVNSVEAMKTCSSLLITYGGHPQASGFTLKNENLEDFKKCLIEYFKK